MRSFLGPLLFILLTTLPHSSALIFPGEEDTDGDGLANAQEDVNRNSILDPGETDPLNADTDRGGEADGSEVRSNRNPRQQEDDLTFDRDGDGLVNGEELLLGTNPDLADTDGDGVLDALDPFPLSAAFTKDENNNGIADEWETTYTLSTLSGNTASADPDGDGLSNIQEFVEDTNPLEADTDRDGVVDGIEVLSNTSPIENPCLSFAAPLFTFDDVQRHWSKTFALRLHRATAFPEELRIIEGYPFEDRRLFLPDRNITRFEFLKVALLSSCIKLFEDRGEQFSLSFSDVSPLPRPFEPPGRSLRRRVIYTAVRHGVVEGYRDGTFRPDDPINRAEALKILLLTANLHPIPHSGALPFSDVSPNEWFTSFIEKALAYQLIEGYGDGTFRPEQPITRAEAAKITYLTMLSNPLVNGYVLPAEGL